MAYVSSLEGSCLWSLWSGGLNKLRHLGGIGAGNVWPDVDFGFWCGSWRMDVLLPLPKSNSKSPWKSAFPAIHFQGGSDFLLEKGWKRGLVHTSWDGFECDMTGSAVFWLETIVEIARWWFQRFFCTAWRNDPFFHSWSFQGGWVKNHRNTYFF